MQLKGLLDNIFVFGLKRKHVNGSILFRRSQASSLFVGSDEIYSLCIMLADIFLVSHVQSLLRAIAYFYISKC